jgi:hypothetical protein
MKKRKPGRPRIRKSDRKTEFIVVRFSVPDIVMIDHLAVCAGISRSEWIRTVVLKELQRRLKAKV